MVKKQLANGEPCNKCAQAEELLRRRGLWERIDSTVTAFEADASSPGMQLAALHQVSLAPFFIVEEGGTTRVFTSVLKLITDVLSSGAAESPAGPLQGQGALGDLAVLATELESSAPQDVVRRALEHFGAGCVIAFSGAEDVALIDMAVRSGQPFHVLSLDTGRLHADTYRFIEQVRSHFGIEIQVLFPDAERVQGMVQKKGLFSFYVEGHGECCSIRKVEPLRRALAQHASWMTGQRRDQSPTRSEVPIVSLDTAHPGGALVKWNPLARWSLGDVWSYIRERGLPYNPLHDQGFVSIGCEPCTRAVRPGEHERAGRWWWEEATQRECGLHVRK